MDADLILRALHYLVQQTPPRPKAHERWHKEQKELIKEINEERYRLFRELEDATASQTST